MAIPSANLLTECGQRGTSHLHARQHNSISAPQSSERFTQDATREESPRPKGIAGVNQHNIQIALQRMMLKTIIEDQHLRPKLLIGIVPSTIAILANQYWDPREGTRQKIRFIPGCLPVEQGTMTRRHHPHMRHRMCSIAPAQHSHAPALLLVPTCHPHGQWGFPCATQGEVANTYNETGELVPAAYARSIADQ